MILHTIVPKEVIYQNEFESVTNEMMMSYEGIPVMVQQINNYQVQISKIMSTDPQHYLHTKCYPGAIISIWPG